MNYSTIPEHKYVITRRKTEHKQFITTVFDDRIAIVAHYIEFIEGIKLKFSYDNLSTIYLIECINYYSFIEDNRHISKLTMIIITSLYNIIFNDIISKNFLSKSSI